MNIEGLDYRVELDPASGTYTATATLHRSLTSEHSKAEAQLKGGGCPQRLGAEAQTQLLNDLVRDLGLSEVAKQLSEAEAEYREKRERIAVQLLVAGIGDPLESAERILAASKARPIPEGVEL